jgi:hypothetical protein
MDRSLATTTKVALEDLKVSKAEVH